MADAFANLSKQERIEKAVAACAQENNKLSTFKTGKIFNIAPSTISRRLNKQTKPKKHVDEAQQLLSPVEERTLVRWVIQYYKWGLPLALKQIRQFALEILIRKNPQPYGKSSSLSDR